MTAHDFGGPGGQIPGEHFVRQRYIWPIAAKQAISGKWLPGKMIL